MDKCVAESSEHKPDEGPNLEVVSSSGDPMSAKSSLEAKERETEVSPFDAVQEQLLDLPLTLEWVVDAGFISQRQAEDILIAPRTKKELNMHPLEILASREYENRLNPGHNLDLETLTTWLAEKTGG